MINRLYSLQCFTLFAFFVSIHIDKLCSIIFGILFMLSILRYRYDSNYKLKLGFDKIDKKYILVSGAILLVDLILILIHGNYDSGFNTVKKDFHYYVFMVLLIYFINDKYQLMKIYQGLLVAGIIVPLYTIWLNLHGIKRAYGLISNNVNDYSTQLLIMLPIIMFSGWFLRKHKWCIITACVSTMGLLYAIIQAASRGAFLSLLLGILTMLLLFSKRRLWYSICFISTIFLLVVGLFLCDSLVIQRLLDNISISSHANMARMNIYTNSFKMFIDHWFSGVGIGNFRDIYWYYMSNDIPYQHFVHAHNWILMYMAEGGIIGLIGLVIFISWQYYFYGQMAFGSFENIVIRNIGKMMLCIFIFLNLYMMVEYTLYVSELKRIIWCTLALGYSTIKVNSDRKI